MRRLLGTGARGAAHPQVQILSIPPPNMLHKGYHHQPEQHQAANSPPKQRFPASPALRSPDTPPTPEEKERRWGSCQETPYPTSQPWGAKPPGPSVCLAGVTHLVGIFGSGCGCTGSGDGEGQLLQAGEGVHKGMGGSVPGDKGSVPGVGGSDPGKEGSVPGDEGSVPRDGRSIPGDKGSVPGVGGSDSGAGGSIPGDPGSFPGDEECCPGSVPRDGGSIPG